MYNKTNMKHLLTAQEKLNFILLLLLFLEKNETFTQTSNKDYANANSYCLHYSSYKEPFLPPPHPHPSPPSFSFVKA